MIRAEALIPLFQRMYREHWSYVWGKAEEGCVDCSGAFVWAFKQLGGSIAHGSNSIARKYIAGELLPLSAAEPGMAAFKVREWSLDESGNKWYNTPPGDVYHVGLVDEDVHYVLNAKGTKSGFCRDKLTYKNGWDFVARLKDVDYETEGEPMQRDEARVVLPDGTSGSTVNMRKAPNKSSELVERVPVGSTVIVLSDQGQWCSVQYGKKVGYMMSNFIEYAGMEEQTETETGDAGIRLTADQVEQIGQALDLIGAIVGRG